MMRRRSQAMVLATAMALFGIAPAWAGDPSASGAQPGDMDMARLESLLHAQQAQIEVLQSRLAAAEVQDEDAGRVEAMKQQIREVLSEQEFRESLMPSMMQAGYDDGFFIKSSDDNFLMKLNGLLQFRWSHYGTRADNRYLNPFLQRNDRTGFDLTRLRLKFSGHAYTPDLTYKIELEADGPDGYDAVLRQAWVDYAFCEAFHVRSGLFRAASTRSNLRDDGALQFVDRPVFDAVYGAGFSVGVRFWGQLFDKRLEYYLDVMNSLGSGEDFATGRTITPDPAELDGNPALLFRAVWHALGDDPTSDFVDEADLACHESPALDFGFHYAFNEDESDALTTRIPFPINRRFLQGGFGLTNTNGLQINEFGFDAAFKYMGFSATSEYVVRIVDPRRAGRRPFAPWWLLTRQGDTTAQHGAYAQLGYLLPIPGLENKIEAVARVGGVSTLANGRECTWEYGAGLNYYIDGNNVKLQTDVIKVTEAPTTSQYTGLANVNDDVLLWRVQLQVAF